MDSAEYHSQDFDWDEHRKEVEKNYFELGDGSTVADSVCCQVEAWDKFHNSHSHGLFFKERRYLLKEFPDLVEVQRPFTVLEIGCGAGSSTIPILRGNERAIVKACDLSQKALSITKRMAQKIMSHEDVESRLQTFLCDPSLEPLPSWLACKSCRCMPLPQQPSCCLQGVDFVTMIFTLSAVPLEKMERVIKQCFEVLRPGGELLFRDYGLYDMTMLRFPPSQRLGNVSFRRLDGTLSYFFSCEVVRELFTSAGFVEKSLEYCCVKLLNRKKEMPMKRVWVHAEFRKPLG